MGTELNPVSHNFGLSVRYLREDRGWSQEVLAEHADLNRSYIGEIERGLVTPSLATTEKIARALGIRLSELIEHAEYRTPHFRALTASFAAL